MFLYRPRLVTAKGSQVAAAKGLVAGSFRLTRRDTSVIDFTLEPEVRFRSAEHDAARSSLSRGF